MIAAKYYIKDKESLSSHKCSFCLEIDYEFYMPECPYKQQLCRKCFYLWGTSIVNQFIHACEEHMENESKKGEFFTMPVEFVCLS